MKKILFIEDESSLQSVFSNFLREKGYEVISALDGEIGLRMAGERKPDLILLDLILPKIHGLDVLKQLKQGEGTKHIPVIVLTNLEGASEVNSAIELGATTYLVKMDYSLEEVFEKVKRVLEEGNGLAPKS